MGVIDHKTAQGDLLIILSYLETIGFGYLPEVRLTNLKNYLTTFARANITYEPITLEPQEGHPFGSLFLSNRGTKRLIIRKMEVIEI